jgi:hypothetical protein
MLGPGGSRRSLYRCPPATPVVAVPEPVQEMREEMAFDGLRKLSRTWRQWFSRRSRRRSAPSLRLTIAPRSLGPSWLPAKGPGGRPMLQVMIELEARNVADYDIRITRAALRDHPAEQASFTVGPARGDDHPRPDLPVPAGGAARITLMFFLKARPYRPGEAFADVVTLVDQDGCEHDLKTVMRGR